MMIKLFLGLEWKSFVRSASFGKSLGIKILLGFLAIYFMAVFLIMGIALFPALKKIFPDEDPFLMVNGFLFYWILGDLLMRFFFQKLPVMHVKPLLVLPIKRRKIVNYVLGKSVVSFFNFLPFFAIIPFGVTLILNDYPLYSVVFWMLALALTVFVINFFNFIVENYLAEKELSFLPVVLLVGLFFAMDYFDIVSFRAFVSKAYLTIYDQPYYNVVLVVVLMALYVLNGKLLTEKLFLDSGLKSEIKEVRTSNLNWTKNFGGIAPFMQMDLKLIWRNKRSKSSVWIVLMGLLYGLFFYPNPRFQDLTSFYVFVGVFSTGIFLINFGQFIPAWDSSYYKLLMSQNIKYKQYLESKFTLMALSVVILFVLGIPYVYFGWKVLLAHFAAAIYNVGVNSHVILYGGSFNRKKIDLSQKAAFNYQGTGAVQWLIGVPLMLLPMGIFALFNTLIGFEIASLVLIISGIVGIVFHEKLMQYITRRYLNSKYKMIDAFGQDN